MNHLEKTNRKTHPRTEANIFSTVFFSYTLKIFRSEFFKTLNDDDFYNPPVTYDSKTLVKNLETNWTYLQKEKKAPSLFLLLWKTYGKYYIFLGIIQFFVDVFLIPKSNLSILHVYAYGASLVALQIFGGVYEHNNALLLRGLGIKARTAFTALIYKKLLKLHQFDVNNNLGNILTHITKDVYALETFPETGNETWILFLKTVTVTAIFCLRVGTKKLLASMLFWIYIPILIYGLTKIVANKKKLCLAADQRYEMIRDLLTFIKSVKMNAWEKLFGSKISDARRKEVVATQNIFLLKSLFAAVGNALGASVIILIFTICRDTTTLTAEVIYYIFATFRTLTIDVGTKFTKNLYKIAEFYISVQRIQLFLHLTDLQQDSKDITKLFVSPSVNVKDLDFSIKNKLILSNVNCTFDKDLTLVTGLMGSGKSLFLQIILDEYQPLKGKIQVNGSIAFASQEPWLFPSTIQQNILFGQKYDHIRYQDVLDKCCLSYDLNLFDEGDLTIVQDRGLNLSKGQQIRINLARAIYKNADIYVLDNCLDALDNNVKSVIFETCLKGLLKDKIVILVVQDNYYINKVEKIVCLDSNESKLVPDNSSSEVNDSKHNLITNDSCLNHYNKKFIQEEYEETTKLLDNKNKIKIYREMQKSGSISLGVYQKYINYGGGYVACLLVVGIFAMAQLSFAYRNILLSKWANLEDKTSRLSVSNSTETANDTLIQQSNKLFVLYNTASVASIILLLSQTVFVFFFAKKIAFVSHKKLLHTLIHAPLTFFDKHLIGTILNRFSKDFIVIDEVLQQTYGFFLWSSFSTIGTVIVIAQVKFILVVPILILFVIEYVLCKCYLRTARNLERLEASRRSPLVAYVNSSMKGLATIRNSKMENTLIEEFHEYQNLYTSTSYTFYCCKFAFNFCTDMLNAAILATVIIISISMKGDLASGVIGLTLTQILMLGNTLQLAITSWADIESQMTAFERVLQYTNTEKEEETGLVIDSYPKEGKIVFKTVKLEYLDKSEVALKNINLEIKPRQIIAIVGRTGAGKTSLVSTLFRLYNFEGDLMIDDVNIKTLSLNFLRSSISIVPHESLILKASIRDNIDPNKTLSDDQIWKILRSVNLDKIIYNLDSYILHKDQLSAGQQQLICLARVIANPKKIVIFDEAEANLDYDSSLIVEKIIHNELKQSTVILITHKTPSKLKCDRIITIDNGTILN